MRMFKCKRCDHLFEDGEQSRWTEMHGFSSGSGEDWSGCPLCNGDYEEVQPCEVCGEYSTEEYCPECVKKVRNLFTDFISKNLNDDEYELLLKMIEEDEI